MAYEIVEQYAVWAKPNQNYFRIGLRVAGSGNVYQRDVSGPEELFAIVDLLRNEDTVWYNHNTNLFVVGFEPVGEEESPYLQKNGHSKKADSVDVYAIWATSENLQY